MTTQPPGGMPMRVSDLIEALMRRPPDALVLGILPHGDDGHTHGFMVIGVEPYLNDAGREIAHLNLFDYEAAE